MTIAKFTHEEDMIIYNALLRHAVASESKYNDIVKDYGKDHQIAHTAKERFDEAQKAYITYKKVVWNI